MSAALCLVTLSLGGGLATGCASGGSMQIQTSNDDASITARVKAALLNDTQINATNIDVSTSGGVVTLAGRVRSQAEIDRAVQLARGAAGVRDVKANLHVGG